MLNQLVEHFAMELNVQHQAEKAKVSYRDVQTENLDSQWRPHSYPDLCHTELTLQAFQSQKFGGILYPVTCIFYCSCINSECKWMKCC